jgi:hypothetical protein
MKYTEEQQEQYSKFMEIHEDFGKRKIAISISRFSKKENQYVDIFGIYPHTDEGKEFYDCESWCIYGCEADHQPNDDLDDFESQYINLSQINPYITKSKLGTLDDVIRYFEALGKHRRDNNLMV